MLRNKLIVWSSWGIRKIILQYCKQADICGVGWHRVCRQEGGRDIAVLGAKSKGLASYCQFVAVKGLMSRGFREAKLKID